MLCFENRAFLLKVNQNGYSTEIIRTFRRETRSGKPIALSQLKQNDSTKESFCFNHQIFVKM